MIDRNAVCEIGVAGHRITFIKKEFRFPNGRGPMVGFGGKECDRTWDVIKGNDPTRLIRVVGKAIGGITCIRFFGCEMVFIHGVHAFTHSNPSTTIFHAIAVNVACLDIQ